MSFGVFSFFVDKNLPCFGGFGTTLESQQADCLTVDPRCEDIDFFWETTISYHVLDTAILFFLRILFVVDELEKFSTLPKTNLAGSTTLAMRVATRVERLRGILDMKKEEISSQPLRYIRMP